MNAQLGPPEDLRPDRPTNRISNRIFLVAECASTNDLALDGHGDARDGDVFLAEHQVAGRGRLGRKWTAPRGAAVLMSVRLLERYSAARWARLSLAAGIAVVEAVKQAAGVVAALKWPNDVLVGRKKLAGILIETKTINGPEHLVALGVGINCLQHRAHFPVELREEATSLDLESRRPIDRRQVARCLISALDEWLDVDVLDRPLYLKDQWCKRSALIGSRLRVQDAGRTYSGVVVDLDPDAGILLALDEGAHRLFSPYTTSTL